MLRTPGRLDSQREIEAMENSNKFFEGKEGKFVYILNAKVKVHKYPKVHQDPKINKTFTLLNLDQWSQIRDVTNEDVKKITYKIANPSQSQAKESRNEVVNTTTSTKKSSEGETGKPHEKKEQTEKKPRKEREPLPEEPAVIVDLKNITPNDRFVDIIAKVVEVVQFKRGKGFLAATASGEEQEEVKTNFQRITLEDNSGKIYCVLPVLEKFNDFKVGNVLHLHRANIERFEGDIKNEV